MEGQSEAVKDKGLSKISQYVLAFLLIVFGAVSVPVKACVDAPALQNIAAAPSDIR